MMPTTMCLGPVAFTMVTNLQEYQTSSEASYAKHDVVKAAPIYEAMGDEETTISFQGVVHPHITGVDGSLAAIEQARVNQIPLPLMRGDHTPMGWVIILKFERTDSTLEETGRALEIQFNVTLAKVSSVGSAEPASILRLFASALG